MTDTPKSARSASLPATQAAETDTLVLRSVVPAGKKYREYKQYLRSDFFHSCAYCTMTESEAQAIRMTIDHYEPKSARPDLENEYSNLMYCCEECNTLKGDLTPPENARAVGYHFFRPDKELRQDHFSPNGECIEANSKVGEFSIDCLELNRLSLKRIRKVRASLTKSHQYIVNGIMGLRNFPIDQLPANVRGRAVKAIDNLDRVGQRFAENVDSILQEFAKSELVDPDPDAAQRANERSEKKRAIQGLFPGQWRARPPKRQ
ncbi:MAG TPA: HNH endonuclease [Stellaceae bacterium]|jgi:5-methylcytosine-specific restriction endonuclease McrA|nr:HNH endonuclease [Stellaceae bacterium]